MKNCLLAVLLLISATAKSQTDENSALSLASLRIGGAYFYGGGAGANMGLSVGAKNLIAEFDYLESRGGKK